jgi:hypothetical protein
MQYMASANDITWNPLPNPRFREGERRSLPQVFESSATSRRMPRGFRIARFISSLETQEERRLRLTTIALAGALALASTITVAQEPEAAESVVQEPEQAEPE